MSPKLGAMTQRMPHRRARRPRLRARSRSRSSRPPTRMHAHRRSPAGSGERPGSARPSGSNRRSWNRKPRIAGVAGVAQEARRHDLVGVDVRCRSRIAPLRTRRSSTAPSCTAPHVAGDRRGGRAAPWLPLSPGSTRWVRAPRPWRPAKLRFEVEAQRCPARPGRRSCRRTSSSPARATRIRRRANTLSSPSSSAARLTASRAGADHRHGIRTAAARCRADHVGRFTQVLEAAVGARADEDAVDRAARACG